MNKEKRRANSFSVSYRVTQWTTAPSLRQVVQEERQKVGMETTAMDFDTNSRWPAGIYRYLFNIENRCFIGRANLRPKNKSCLYSRYSPSKHMLWEKTESFTLLSTTSLFSYLENGIRESKVISFNPSYVPVNLLCPTDTGHTSDHLGSSPQWAERPSRFLEV